MPLTSDLFRVKQYRSINPELADISDRDLADIVYQQTGELGSLRDSSALGRTVARGSNFLTSTGESLERGITNTLGDSYPARLGARTANIALQSTPEYLMNLAAARVLPQSKLGAVGIGALNAFTGYGRTAVETGDQSAALGAGAGTVASMIGALTGAKLGNKFGGKIGGAAGGFIGSMPGDALEIATQPGGWEEFLKDPLNLPATLLSQAPYAAVDHFVAKGEAAKENREKTIAATPALDEISGQSIQQELIGLKKTPVSQLSEQKAARMSELEALLKKTDAQVMTKDGKQIQKVAGAVEHPLTASPFSYMSQIANVSWGKRPAMFVPKGSLPELETVPFAMQGFKTYETPDGDWLYNPAFTSEQAIKDSVAKGDTNGILGLGPTGKNDQSMGVVGVLRNRQGLEKLGVELEYQTKQSMLKRLQGMALKGDTVTVEPLADFLKKREKQKGTVALYSLEQQGTPEQKEVTRKFWQNSLLKKFQSALLPTERKGARFELDANGELGNAGVVKAMRQWVPPAMMEHYEASGLQNFLDFNRTESDIKAYNAVQEQIQLRKKEFGTPEFNKIWAENERIKNKYKGYVPTTSSKSDKVSFAALSDWLEQNTPQIEIKQLNPNAFKDANSQRLAQLQHTLETAGYRVEQDMEGNPEISYSGEPVTEPADFDRLNIPQADRDLINSFWRSQIVGFEIGTDAATGKYGVEPINVNEMDSPVDILVRVPTRQLTYDEIHQGADYGPETNKQLRADYEREAAANNIKRTPDLFSGPHFGDSDLNVLASVRGYFKNLPTGERAFFPFEVQSDWAQGFQGQQKRLDEMKARFTLRQNEDKTYSIFDKEYNYDGRKFADKAEAQARYETILGAESGYGRRNIETIKNHALLSSYETLAVKAAIQHALANGATKIVFPDSKTAMMIEGHDKRPRSIANSFENLLDRKPSVGDWVMQGGPYSGGQIVSTQAAAQDIARSYERYNGAAAQTSIRQLTAADFITEDPRQTKGMRQHYDNSIPGIVSRLTNDSGKQVDMGVFTARTASEHFKNPDGTPKDRITGRVYDLSNLKPDVENLFAMYGQPDQANYAEGLKHAETELEKRIHEGADVTSEELMDALSRGENVDKAIALNYLKGLLGNVDKVRAFLSDPVSGINILGRTVGTEVALNLKQKNEKAFGILGHELSHVSAHLLEYGNPEAYKDFISYPTVHMTAETRKMALEELYKAAGIEAKDLDYAAGLKFNKDDPNLAKKQALEFYGALAEVLSTQVFRDSGINPTIKKYLSWLPMGAQRWLTTLSAQFTKFMGGQTPSLRYMLDAESQKLVTDAYSKLVKFTHQTQTSQNTAIKSLKRLGLYDEQEFISNLANFNDRDRWGPAERSARAMGDMANYALDFTRASQFAKKSGDVFEDWVMSPLFRTKLHPETLDFFRELHHYRNKIKQYEHGYMAYLGQNADGTRSQEQALQAADDHIQSLIRPGKGRNDRLLAMSKVIARNQEIRENVTNPPLGAQAGPQKFVTKDQLVSVEEMKTKYGLSEQDADFLNRLIDLPKQVSEQTLRFMQATDTVNMSKLFYIQNRDMNISAVKGKVAELTRISNDAGANSLENKMYQKYHEQIAQRSGDNTDTLNRLSAEIAMTEQRKLAFNQQMELHIRQAFANEIQFDPRPGQDPFINQVTAAATRLAEARAEQAFIMKDEGYAPMTRRGRYLVQVYKDALGTPLPNTVQSMQGFKTLQEARAFMAANKLTDGKDSKLIDKETFVARAQMYSSQQLQSVRDKARRDFDDVIRAYEKNLPDSPHKAAQLQVLSDMKNQYRPLQQEISEVISAKGDKFKERRYNVEGFNELDFIPNIFEYVNYKTIVGQKGLTRAEAELQTLRPTVQSDPAMQARMAKETDYVLNHTSEAAGIRKLVFYNYLGGSVRHMIQNLLQVPLNGIPEMFAQGAGHHSYSHAVKAGYLATKYMKDGTTGNKNFDILLKQAEKEGVTIPNAIEHFAPESSAMEGALDNVNAQMNGTKQLGERVNYAGTQVYKGFEKFMRATATASERTNRQVSFIMSLLESERKGSTDLRKMYNDANVFTDYVNFVGDKSNRPGFQVKLGQSWAHAPMLVATALQSFVINHISQLYAYGKMAMKGDINAKKAFATGTVHLLAMAGAMGLPFAQNAEQLFEAATGISLKEAIRRKLILGAQELFDLDANNGGRIADTVMSGFPRLLGIEAGQSVGLGDPLFRVEAGKVPSAYDLAGPAGGLAEKAVQGLDALTANPWDGESWWKATRTVAPQALNYWLKLSDALMKGGYYDKGGAPLVENLDSSASVSLLGGFTPTEVSDVRTVQNLRRKVNEKIDRDYSTAVDLTAKALLNYERTQRVEDLMEANKRFGDYIEAAAGTQDRGTMVTSVSNRVEQLKSAVEVAPSLRESQAFSEARTSYPGTVPRYSERLPAAFSELKVARSLGQDDILLQKLGGLKSSLIQKALYDQLVRVGFEPYQASQIAQGGKSAVQKTIRTSNLSSPVPLEP